MGSCCMKSKKQTDFSKGLIYNNQMNNHDDHQQFKHLKPTSKSKLTPEERERRRAEMVQAAEQRQAEAQAKGLSRKTQLEIQWKQKREQEAYKSKQIGEKNLEWRV